MAINYTNLFTVLGKYVKAVNTFDGQFAALDTQQDDIEAILEANSLNHLITGLPYIISNAQTNVEQWIQGVVGEAQKVLFDEDYVKSELGSANNSTTEVLYAMMQDIEDQSVTIKQSTSTVSSSAFAAGKDQRVEATALLGENLSIPNAVVAKHPIYDNIVGTMCSTDSSTDNLVFRCIDATPGQERFTIVDKHSQSSAYAKQVESFGVGPVLTINTSKNMVKKNANFETFTSIDIPTDWTYGTSIVGTDFAQYNIAYRGIKSVAIKTSDTTFYQTINDLSVGIPYLASFRLSHPDLVSTIDTNPTHSTVQAKMFLTWGLSTGGIGFLNTTASGAASGRWTFCSGAFVLPPTYVPNTFQMGIGAGTLAASNWTLLDEASIVPLTYFAGANYTILRGNNNDLFSLGDSVATGFSPIVAGVFQDFFRKTYGIQLPSAASPTIADSLAT